jgi:DeoR/GlpR family transcriptional regulator of sugar metabolism
MNMLRFAMRLRPLKVSVPRFAEERQRDIARQLKEVGRVEVAALAMAYNVSEDSVRRDLQALAARGLVQKTHGGAIALQPGALPMGQRLEVQMDTKNAIALAAAAHVESNQSLFVDSGSTALAFARALCAPGAPRPLAVFTASLDVALLMSGEAHVTLRLAGGEWSPSTRAFLGDAAVDGARSWRADWAFIGACAVHPRLGLSAVEVHDALIKRAMLEGAAQRVLLCDSSKFDMVQSYAVATLDQIDRVISDAAPKWLLDAVMVEEVGGGRHSGLQVGRASDVMETPRDVMHHS